MGRKIILLSDGTGNSSAKVWRTNVWRTFEALDLSGNDQVAYYDDGVGTSSFKPMAILGGAFGFGLKRNVIALYKFACRNYHDPEDELFGFGFSRGAFTIRIVMGLILHEGLVQAETEGELHHRATNAYRHYRKQRYHTIFRIEAPLRWLRDLLPWFRYDPSSNREVKKIAFVGVWDTVSAYGMPVDEMTQGISKYIYPLDLPDHDLVRARVTRACHALSLDETRKTFHPELWNERTVQPPVSVPTKDRAIKDEQISQVWFAGVHSNVGGGYPDDSLAYVPFVWMITEARRCGLKFKSDYADDPNNPDVMRADPDTFKHAVSARDKDGRLYDPRQGLGGIYRYGPRDLVSLCDERFSTRSEVFIPRPKIHESALKRIENNAHAYAPIGLPETYDVVTDAGEILTVDDYKRRYDWAESSGEAQERISRQHHVWWLVRDRQIVYFMTLAAATWLLLFPFFNDTDPNQELFSPIRWVSAIIRFVGGFLPGLAAPSIEGYAREPKLFLIGGIVLGLLLFFSSFLAGRVTDTMEAIWQRPRLTPASVAAPHVRESAHTRLGPGFYLRRVIAPFAFAVLTVAVIVLAANKASFTIYDVAGYTCIDAKRNPGLEPARTLARHEKSDPIDFDIKNLCGRTRLSLEGNGAKYRVTINVKHAPEAQWRDRDILMPPGGFSSSSPKRECSWIGQPNALIEEASWASRARLSLGIPLRRRYDKDWGRILLRIGSEGAEEEDYHPDADDCFMQWTFAPKRGGELFIYVNDAIVGLPGVTDYFYRNNFGKGILTVERL